MIKIDNISKVFSHRKKKIHAVKNISLEIKQGEFLSITGPSGSGKSTLLLILGGMTSPSEGRVFWNNESIFDWNLKQRARWRAKTVGFVFQTFNLIPYLTVFENVNIALELSGNKDTGDKDIIKILEKIKLSDRLDHIPKELSVGQQQRVALARAMIKNPRIILADEPTGNLDPGTASEILTILQELNKEGKTVILITHDPSIAKMANRNIQIIEGSIPS